MTNFWGGLFLISIFTLAVLGPAILGGWLRKKYAPMPFWGPLFRRVRRKLRL